MRYERIGEVARLTTENKKLSFGSKSYLLPKVNKF